MELHFSSDALEVADFATRLTSLYPTTGGEEIAEEVKEAPSVVGQTDFIVLSSEDDDTFILAQRFKGLDYVVIAAHADSLDEVDMMVEAILDSHVDGLIVAELLFYPAGSKMIVGNIYETVRRVYERDYICPPL